jgi:hypothetical protein
MQTNTLTTHSSQIQIFFLNLLTSVIYEFFYNSIHHLPSSLFQTLGFCFNNFVNMFTLCFHICSRSMLHKHSRINVGVCACIYFFSTISSQHTFNGSHWLPFQVYQYATLLYHFMNRILVVNDMLCSLTTSLT